MEDSSNSNASLGEFETNEASVSMLSKQEFQHSSNSEVMSENRGEENGRTGTSGTDTVLMTSMPLKVEQSEIYNHSTSAVGYVQTIGCASATFVQPSKNVVVKSEGKK